ncbi:MAG: GNAT family N-acetyltransferase [Rhizobiales bacterium]|nr:GNAT family N-acetyltransferase [Hyphomicrobiales bacterium]
MLRIEDAFDVGGVPRRDAMSDGPLTVSVLRDGAAIEREWRAMAARGDASVYQQFGWTAAWAETMAREQAIEPVILAIRTAGRLAMILPLGVERIGPLRIARYPGGEHANIRMPLTDPDCRAALEDPVALAKALQDALRAAPIAVDLIDLDALPLQWNGADVPLAYHPEAKPARLPLGRLELAADLATTLGPERRGRKAKKHRSQVNALAPVGGYRFRRAESEAEALALFAQFRAEKAAWFARMGIDDSFAEPGVPAFFHALIARRWQQGEALLDLYAIEFDGSIRAIFGGGEAGGRLSGYFLSVSDDAWRRITPGELLLHDLTAHACAAGLTAFDLGRGDDRYKWSWLQTAEPQVRLILPVTLRGRAGLALIRMADRLEQRIRSNERLFRFAKALRRRIRGQESPPSDQTGD